MSKISTCPICEVSIQPDTEQCPNCRWVLTEHSLLDREKYNRLVDWAVDCYKELDELRSRSTYHKEKLIDRLNRQRDDIDRLQKQVDRILINIPEDRGNSLDAPISSIVSNTSPSTEDLCSLSHTPIYGQQDDPITSIDSTSSNLTISYDVGEKNDSSSVPTHDLFGSNRGDVDPNSINAGTVIVDEQDLPQQSEPIGLTQVQTKIISDYYHNSSDFDKIYHPKVATITKETINNNWASEQKVLILTEAERGNYWIFESEGICYVVPYYGKYFNQHSYQTLSTIFDCENYTPDYNNIQLLAAAIVTKESATNPQTWRLQLQGKLFFK
jgi:Zn-finger nucleic acid-binding protein